MKRPTLRARKYPSVENVLGGKGVVGAKPRTSLHWVGMIREDIPAAAVESVLSVVNVSQSELAQAFGIPERTLARRKREGVLNSEESSKLLRLARVMSRAREVFDGAAAAIAFAVSRGVIRQVYRIEQWSRHDMRTIEYDDGRVKTPAHKLKTIWHWSFEGAPAPEMGHYIGKLVDPPRAYNDANPIK